MKLFLQLQEWSYYDFNCICLIHEVQIVSDRCQECLSELLKKEVYVKQPSRFENVDISNHLSKLDKALYGLKHTPRVWYEILSKFLNENGFKREKIDHTLLLKSRGKKLPIVQVDTIFGATSISLCKDFAALMESEFWNEHDGRTHLLSQFNGFIMLVLSHVGFSWKDFYWGNI